MVAEEGAFEKEKTVEGGKNGRGFITYLPIVALDYLKGSIYMGVVYAIQISDYRGFVW